MRERSIYYLHERYQKALYIRKKLHDGAWKSWLGSMGVAGGSFWGNYKYDRTGFGISLPADIVFVNIYDKSSARGSYSVCGFNKSDPHYAIRILPDHEIPNLIGDPLWKGHEDLIEDRLSGKIKFAPYRQDLIDVFMSLETRDEHIYRVISKYRTLLESYVLHEYIDEIEFEPVIFSIKISGVQYILTYRIRNERNESLSFYDGKFVSKEYPAISTTSMGENDNR